MHTHAPLRPVVILGPTAGGKSELAVALAERLRDGSGNGGEILGADSMQIYRHLDAGTAKPEPELRRRVTHHLIDIVSPTQRFTVADWVRQADALIRELPQRGKCPIIVGGTNLYLKVLLEGMFEAPGHDTAFRASLTEVPTAELHQRLGSIDPAAAGRIHPNDRKRIVRALEVHHITGKPISAQQQQWQDQGAAPQGEGTERAGEGAVTYRHDPILIGLDWPPPAINARINQRVKQMFHPAPPTTTTSAPAPAPAPAPGPPEPPGPSAAAHGQASPESLPDEVRRLESQGLLGPQAREALGYKQVLAALAGRCSMDEAFEQTKIQTRRLAKQQRTWLRRFRGVHWLAAGELDTPALADRAWALVRRE